MSTHAIFKFKKGGARRKIIKGKYKGKEKKKGVKKEIICVLCRGRVEGGQRTERCSRLSRQALLLLPSAGLWNHAILQ